jgi:hypothetical protein
MRALEQMSPNTVAAPGVATQIALDGVIPARS